MVLPGMRCKTSSIWQRWRRITSYTVYVSKERKIVFVKTALDATSDDAGMEATTEPAPVPQVDELLEWHHRHRRAVAKAKELERYADKLERHRMTHTCARR